MESFKEYFERTWIGNQATPSVFPPEVWNHHNSVVACLSRTTNIAKDYHHAFLTLMGCKHPSIWKFLDMLKKEQDLTSWKIA